MMLRFRPRLRFSLRTLFVLVTVLGIPLGWVGYQLRIVRERKEVREWVEAHGYETGPGSWVGQPGNRLPWIRQMLGDQELWGPILENPTSQEVERVKRAFPEAAVSSIIK